MQYLWLIPAGAESVPGWVGGCVVVLGLVVGIILNELAYRLPIVLERQWLADMRAGADDPALYGADGADASERIWTLRRACSRCGHTLTTKETVALVGWILARGRCSQCCERLDVLAVVVELASVICAVGVFALFGATGHALAAFVLCAVLIAASAIDVEHQLLPDALTLPLLWVGLAVNLTGMFTSLPNAVLGAIFGYLSLWSVYWLVRLVGGVEGMGFGDLKLLAALGAWLGYAVLPQIVAIAAVAAAVAGLGAVCAKRMETSEPLPFGPWLALGGLVTLFVGVPRSAAVLHWFLLAFRLG